MKHIGSLSFGHWTPSPQSHTRSAADALAQTIALAVAAEVLGTHELAALSEVRRGWPGH